MRKGDFVGEKDEITLKIIRHRHLNVYKEAFGTVVRLFEVSKSFPREERYS